MNDPTDLGVWAARLRSLAEPVLADAGPPDPASFRDERGSSQAVYRPFLEWRTGRRSGDGPACDGLKGTPEMKLWFAIAWGTVDPDAFFERWWSAAGEAPGRGALLPQSPWPSIEVWTESELSCLHALWWCWIRHGSTPARRRALDAAAWHVEHLQPDNATNRPWACHVFLELPAPGGDEGARLHAQTLIHNCQVGTGRPDIISAHILADAAEALDRGR